MAQFNPPADEVRTYREEYGCSLFEAKTALIEKAKATRLNELLSEAEQLLPYAYPEQDFDRQACDQHQLVGALIRALRILTRGEE